MTQIPARISIIVLNWETPANTCACLKALSTLEQAAGLFNEPDVIIVDNGSTDDSLKQLQHFVEARDGSRFRLIESGTNRGYAGGNNLAIRYALDHIDPDYIWILNSDTRPHPDALARLVEAACAEPRILVWGSTLLNESGHKVEAAGGCYYHPCLSLQREALSGLPVEALEQTPLPRALDYISGAAMFVDARFFREQGLLNEDYFLFFEELDITRRAGEDRIAWCPGSKVLHEGGVSMKRERKRGTSGIAEYHCNLSALKYTRRHHPRCFPFMAPFRLVARMALHASRAHWDLYAPLFRAYRDYFLDSPTNLTET